LGTTYILFNDYQHCFYNIYEAKYKSNYDWHFDSSRSDVYDMKLTVLINLSIKDYEGGDFHIFNENEYKIPDFKEPGSILIFKSYLNHKVYPVNKGERRTLTYLLMGLR
jgi:PKHD-type hydroxylase